MSGYTARWFLGVDDGTLSRSVEHTGVLSAVVGGIGRLSGGGRAAVGDEFGRAVGILLDVDLGTVLLDGWRTAAQLRKAARSTVADPHSSVVVDLAQHRVSFTYRPHIDLLVDGQTIGGIEVELSLVFDLYSVQATVRAGRLAALRCGQCDLTGTVLVAGKQILERTGRIDPALIIKLDQGIPLLPAGEIVDPGAATVRL